MDLLDRFVTAVFSLLLFKLCNEFLRQTTDAKLTARGVDAHLRLKSRLIERKVFFKSNDILAFA
jgi:hypothetical protein